MDFFNIDLLSVDTNVLFINFDFFETFMANWINVLLLIFLRFFLMDLNLILLVLLTKIDLILCLYLNLKCSLRSKVEHINPILTTNQCFFLFYFTVFNIYFEIILCTT